MCPLECPAKLVEICKNCSGWSAAQRPSMKEVVFQLTELSQLMESGKWVEVAEERQSKASSQHKDEEETETEEE